MKTAIIYGAYSAIVYETIKNIVDVYEQFILLGRDHSKLEVIQKDLLARGAKSVHIISVDLSKSDDAQKIFEQCKAITSTCDLLYIGYGVLPDNALCEKAPAYAHEMLEINYMSVISHLAIWSIVFREQQRGTIAVITSVAGDRGRKSNYFYGSAKGGVSLFLEGLQASLDSFGVRVIDIRPGFVDTPMTEHLKKGLLFASAEDVGASIAKKLKSKEDIFFGDLFYVPWFWRIILLIVKIIPRKIFSKLPL